MMKDIFQTQIELSFRTAQANLEGIDHDAGLIAPGAGGNGINWVLGHVVNTRNVMLELLGAERVMDERGAAVYGRGAKPVGPGDECLPLVDLRAFLDATQETLLQRLAEADEALFAREVPDLFDPDVKTTCGRKLAALLFHEAYHMGQIGTIRRAIGREPMIG